MHSQFPSSNLHHGDISRSLRSKLTIAPRVQYAVMHIAYEEHGRVSFHRRPVKARHNHVLRVILGSGRWSI